MKVHYTLKKKQELKTVTYKFKRESANIKLAF